MLHEVINNQTDDLLTPEYIATVDRPH